MSRSRRTRTPLSLITICVAVLGWFIVGKMIGCSNHSRETERTKPRRVFGTVGRMPGGFIYPRAIDVDAERERIYVIDRSGRLQVFDFDGEPVEVWKLSLKNEGYPTGVTVAKDGRIFVASTHESKVCVFSPAGNRIGEFGHFGKGQGEFLFVSDVALGPEGRIYVSEYNGNDRIQVFDANFGYLFTFGSFGSEPGQFNRPQSMAFSPDLRELFVADAVNNRIQVFDPAGNLLRTFGTTGTKPGEFRYPYGVLVLEDGRLVVTEFGNSRVQVMDPNGTPRRTIGEPGEQPGSFLAPWSSAYANGTLFVLDSRNSRVQLIEMPLGSSG